MTTMERIKGQSKVLGKVQALVSDLIKQFSEAIGAVVSINDHLYQISNEKPMNWLDAVDSSSLLATKADSRMNGTCEWISEDSEYLRWAKSSSINYLWIQGIPGAGKSILQR
ncbi:Similar to hypothetical protein [Botryotinia fuckeliana]; acc. no. CCD47759 [Pyronema omphalodes CBS 100304]|uniref:Nephrocystin 3-like N-terminal domain-containing protein n=1 Tax=Pyronema omphalodes (strain CBS 100304) TaxID=1076935 RepID=U4LUK2_PYROM|nr:Similar to hypothetical protein [Botryotinia fuckeliana]; acc. no. CCD47759 [Pyronema omphalodes CBS 100304]